MTDLAAVKVGASWQDIPTPALIVDLDALEANLGTMAKAQAELFPTVAIRAHAKAHKCPHIALQQIQHGCVGVCCQKLSEVEAMAQAGVADIFLSNEVVSKAKLQRLVQISDLPGRKISCCVDNESVVDLLAELVSKKENKSQPLSVLVEVDVGQNRCGVAPKDAVKMVQYVCSKTGAGLAFGGLHCYHGSNQHIRAHADRKAAVEVVVATVSAIVKNLAGLGIKVPIVTGGGTGTFQFEATSGVYTEIQPGSYALMDVDYGKNLDKDAHYVSTFKNSLFILTTVMSLAPDRGYVVVDAGLKAQSIDSGNPRVAKSPTNPKLSAHPEVDYVPAGDEHGKLVWTGAAPATPYAIGDLVLLIPGHCDPTCNMYSSIVGMRGNAVEGVYPVARSPGV